VFRVRGVSVTLFTIDGFGIGQGQQHHGRNSVDGQWYSRWLRLRARGSDRTDPKSELFSGDRLRTTGVRREASRLWRGDKRYDADPLAKTPENGFVNDVDGFQLRVYDGTDRSLDARPLATSNVNCEPGYICERDVVERRWAAALEARGVEFRTGRSVSPDEYAEIVESYDYVVDASGQPSLTLKAMGNTRAYTGDMVALNATVKGDLSAYRNWPRLFFEGYVGYAWAFLKSDGHANVGIGWRATGDRMTTSAHSRPPPIGIRFRSGPSGRERRYHSERPESRSSRYIPSRGERVSRR